MSKDFRPWKIDEAQLLPPSVQDYVPRDHLSRLIVALVREELDLSRDCRQLHERAGSAAVRSADDDGAASAWLCERHLLVAADRQGGGGAGGLHDDRGGRPAGLPHDLGVPPAAPEGAGRAVRAGVEAGREGRAGEARARCARRHQDQGERVQAQGDELRAHEEAGSGACRPRSTAGSRPPRRPMRRRTSSTASKRGDEMPDWVADKQKRLAKIRAGQGRAGGGSQGRRRRGDAAPGRGGGASASPKAARRTARRPRRRSRSPTARRSATSPIRKAAS